MIAIPLIIEGSYPKVGFKIYKYIILNGDNLETNLTFNICSFWTWAFELK